MNRQTRDCSLVCLKVKNRQKTAKKSKSTQFLMKKHQKMLKSIKNVIKCKQEKLSF